MKTCPNGAVDESVPEGGAEVTAHPAQTSVRVHMMYTQSTKPDCKPKRDLVVYGPYGLGTLRNMEHTSLPVLESQPKSRKTAFSEFGRIRIQRKIPLLDRKAQGFSAGAQGRGRRRTGMTASSAEEACS